MSLWRKQVQSLSDTPVPTDVDEIEVTPIDNPLSLPKSVGTVSKVVNGIVTPNLRVLLGSVLGAIDASIPNKEQNRSVKHIVRVAFDDAYIDILRRSYPNTDYGYAGDYMLQPEKSREKAFNQALINK